MGIGRATDSHHEKEHAFNHSPRIALTEGLLDMCAHTISKHGGGAWGRGHWHMHPMMCG